MNPKKYVIDANILINFDIFTPQKYHGNFWRELESQVRSGNIVILDKVANECQNPKLSKWLNQLKKKNLITPVTNQIKQAGIQINNTYKMTTIGRRGKVKSQVDTYIIAYALANNMAVFTYENKKRPGATTNKIPDVCLALKVYCQRFSINVFNNLKFQKCS